MRGSWIDFEFDSNDLLYVRIDKKKEITCYNILQAFGLLVKKLFLYFIILIQLSMKKVNFIEN